MPAAYVLRREGARLRQFACAFIALAALSGATICGRSPAAAEEKVKFFAAARAGGAQQAPSGPDGKAAEGERGAPIQGFLTKPKGDGPFPAVVLLHSCLGLPATKRTIGEMFAGWGYVALFADDFTTRGLKETCAREFDETLSDAYGALFYLSRLAYVDAGKIAAVGYSQGADAVLQIASSRFAASFALPSDLKFKAAAAYYPPCANEAHVELKIPTLILIGGLDDVTPAADCEGLANAQGGAGALLKLVVYPGAYHLFDDPKLADGTRLLGMWLKYSPEAAERAKVELRDFLSARLAR